MGIQVRTGSGKSQKAGGLCLIPFGLVFAGMGGVFLWFLGQEVWKEAETYSWTETTCQIESIEIEVLENEKESPFLLKPTFSYEFEGQSYTGESYTRSPSKTDDYEKLALKRRDLLNADQATACWVNPEDPTEAVLKREEWFKGFIILFPLVFVVIGVSIMIGGVVSLRKGRARKAGKVESISATARSSEKVGSCVLLGMGIVFTTIGLGVAIPLGILPGKRMLESENWVETPCTIIWSRVQSHRSDDGTTYSVDIFYEYEFESETHRNNRYEFMAGSSSGRSGKQEVVRQYRPGSQQVCFVNPDLPEQATLKKGFSAWAFLGLIPLFFFIIGVALLIAWIRGRGKKKERKSRFAAAKEARQGREREWKEELETAGSFQPMVEETTGPRILSPGGNRIKGSCGCLFFALFWNGIVSVFVWQAIEGIQKGRPEWFLVIFITPFVLIGLALIIGFLYKLLALANPKPVLTVQPGNLRPGEDVQISWTIRGNARRISHLKMELWGVESATYRRGTKTHTDNQVFFCRTIADSADGRGVENGRLNFQLPQDVVPSLKLGSNQIKWQIRVSGDIPFWPDIQDTFEITVLPARIT
ncbi:MAG: DUF3592 domain-containing protein [Verrucomicrobiales bacterium]|nr:DUF3592 domain-containing protein [Verrucomicrobiales bacterium]